MTRTEFEEDITSWYELIDFCNENDLRSCDNIYDSEQVVEIIRAVSKISMIMTLSVLKQMYLMNLKMILMMKRNILRKKNM